MSIKFAVLQFSVICKLYSNIVCTDELKYRLHFMGLKCSLALFYFLLTLVGLCEGSGICAH